MPTRNVMDRLNDGDVLLLDGGTGSELQRRGADVLMGATAGSGLRAWSATANVDFAEVVQQVHQDYLRVGTDIIISNNFWTIPSRLERIGLADRWQEYARAGGQNAVKARDAGNPEAYVAAGIAPPSLQPRMDEPRADVDVMGREAYHKEYAEHARLLADVGVDAIQPEYVGFIADCVAAVDACAEAGLPVFLGVRHIRQDGRMQYDEHLEDLVEALKGHSVDAILLMCSAPEAISAGLPLLKSAFDGPVGAYPNIGYNPTGPVDPRRPTLTNQLPSRGADIFQTGDYSPSRLAQFARDWKEIGAQIIGGCCATGPEHIQAMRPVVKG